MANIIAGIRWLSSRVRASDVQEDETEQDAGNLVSMCRGTIAKSAQCLQIEPHLVMNYHQCAFLVKRLSKVEKTLAQILDSDPDAGKTTLALQQLHHVLEDAERLLQSSCLSTSSDPQAWVRATLEQNDMKETFSRILYELRWHTYVLQSILVGIALEPTSCNKTLAMEDEAPLVTALKKDKVALKDRLTSIHVKLNDPVQKALAVQLLQRMNLDMVPSKTTSDHSLAGGLIPISPQNPTDFYCGVLLGKGASASVRVTNLLGGEYAVKIFEGPQAQLFEQEVEVLQRLGNHPHIVRLFCHSTNKSNSDCFLIMEKMDMELSEFLKRRTTPSEDDDRDRKLLEAVVLMLQIAEGIRYIHSKKIAHRDLKPGNVLVSVEDRSSPSLSRARSVKIADFGLTKTKNTSRTFEDQTMNTGTSKYMAPEVINEVAGSSNRAVINLQKADSYSFAIMCSEILTGEDPFVDLKDLSANELKRRVKANTRPKLPPDCPLRLTSLINKCWSENFQTRPVFPEICQELRYIKGLLLRGDEQELKEEFASNMVEHQGSHGEEHIVGDKKIGEQVSDIAAPTLPKCVKQGPWGREEPHKRTGLFDHVADSIRWIRVKYQHTPPGVGFLEVGYVSGDTEITQAYCANIIGTNWRTIKFAPDEYIKQVSGSVAPHVVAVSDSRRTVGLVCVISLTIHTNKENYGPFGDNTVGKSFRSGTGKVVGFFGAGTVLLDKLGVWIIPDGEDDGDQSFVIEQ